MKPYFLLLFSCLSANVDAQINYDSIAIENGYLLEENFTYGESELFQEKFNNATFVDYMDFSDSNGEIPKNAFYDEFYKANYSKLIFDEIQNYLTEDVSYNFINYNIDEFKNLYLIFRLYSDDGGVNYHQYLLEPSGIQEYKITDVYFFLGGEYISQTFTTIYKLALESMESSRDVRSNKDKEENFLLTMSKIKTLIQEGHLSKARKMFYNDIPKEIRNKKEFIYLELELADIDDDALIQDIADRLYTFAEEDSPALYLAALNLHTLMEDHAKVITAVDSLYEYTGDELLEIYKGNSYYEMGDYEAAEISLKKANDAYPGIYSTYDLLLYYYKQRDELPKFLNVLDSMQKYLKMDTELLAENLPLDYPDVAASQLYQEWKDQRLGSHQILKDSMASILQGQWIFEKMEDLAGNKIETTEYWDGDFGKTRPDFEFNLDGNFLCQFGEELYDQGTWKFDFAYETIDFKSPFKKKSPEGKKIIENGNYIETDEGFYEIYSYYYYSIDQDQLKLYDLYNGLMVYKKHK